MISGVGPILGEGHLGTFVNGTQRQEWSYEHGNLNNGGYIQRDILHPYSLHKPLPPVAVLTNKTTASAAEAVVVSFRGRPNTRSFGTPTYGVPTAPTPFTLSDGAQVVLGSTVEMDRKGQIYDGPIAPDESANVPGFSQPGQDPLVQMAHDWLHTQAACH